MTELLHPTGLMSPNGYMPAHTLQESDYYFLRAYPWKGARRPHQEPGGFAKEFNPPASEVLASDDWQELRFGCCEKTPWYERLKTMFITHDAP